MPPAPNPADAGRIVALMCQSIELAHAERLPDAIACLDAGLRIDPGFVPCRLARARLLAGARRFDAALADLNAVLARAPSPEVRAMFAALFAEGRADADARLAADPGDRAAHVDKGRLYRAAGDPAAALDSYERALALGADARALHLERGDALYALGRFGAAGAAYECLLALDPDDALAWYNRGNALQKEGRLDAALDAYRQACAIVPDCAEAWLEQAHCRLAQGDFAAGWPLYEWRWRTAQLAATQLAGAQPRWLGDTALVGRTILLWAEQGRGDTIQFARFIPRVADLAAHVVVRAPAALAGLLASVDARVDVVADDAPLPAHDAHCPLMSLPLALGLGAAVAPAGSAYLHAAAAVVPARPTRPRIGLCWSGRRTGAGAAVNPGRDIALAALAPLAGVDADIVPLQPDMTADDAALLAAWPNAAAPPLALATFADTAAVIAGLDLVISVDTAVAHLAGALGTPCRLLLRHAGEWRWQRGRADSPWYPSLTIYRQPAEGDWDAVVRRVAAEVAAWAVS